MNYYVYAILDPNEYYDFDIFKNKPFYIGYGSKNRLKEHLYKRELDRKCHKSCKIKSILKNDSEPIFIKIRENLTFEEANKLEMYYINLFGRIDNNSGILTNHTDGGSGTKNKIISDVTKLKMSNSHKGLKHSDISKLKMSNLHIGKKLSEETKNKISIAKTGEGNAFYGKKHNLDSFKTCKVTLQIDMVTNKIINRFKSSTEAERITGIRCYRVCNGSRKSAGGFKWVYEEDYNEKDD